MILINYVRSCFFVSFPLQQKVFFSVGEAAGKAPLGVAKREDVNVNINQLRGKADSVSGVVNDTRMVNFFFLNVLLHFSFLLEIT